jgi:hypothetical protein
MGLVLSRIFEKQATISGEPVMTSIAYRIAHRRVLVVEELIEEWQLDPERTKIASDAHELVRETADLLKPVERAVNILEENLKCKLDSESKPTHILVLANLVACLLNKTLGLFPRVRCLAKEVQRLGCSVEGLDQLEDSQNALIHLRDILYRTWPLPDENTVKAAKLDLKMGKHRVL